MKRGMSVSVVHVALWLMERQLDEVSGKLLQKSLEARGMKFLIGAQTQELVAGDDGRVKSIRFKDGSELPADLVDKLARLVEDVQASGKKNATRKASQAVLNAIAPGNILFEGGVWDRNTKERPEAWERWIRREVALRRFGTVEEIADAAAFLASPRASSITGEVLVVDGGQVR